MLYLSSDLGRWRGFFYLLHGGGLSCRRPVARLEKVSNLAIQPKGQGVQGVDTRSAATLLELAYGRSVDARGQCKLVLGQASQLAYAPQFFHCLPPVFWAVSRPLR